MIKRTLAICILAVATMAANVHAQQKGGRGEGRGEAFRQMDADGDGKISKAEAEKVKRQRPRIYENFDKIDANSDSYLEKSELRTFMQNNKPARGGE